MIIDGQPLDCGLESSFLSTFSNIYYICDKAKFFAFGFKLSKTLSPISQSPKLPNETDQSDFLKIKLQKQPTNWAP